MKNKHPLDVLTDLFEYSAPTPLEKAIMLRLLGVEVDEETLRVARKEALERNIFVKDTPLTEEEKQKMRIRREARSLFDRNKHREEQYKRYNEQRRAKSAKRKIEREKV